MSYDNALYKSILHYISATGYRATASVLYYTLVDICIITGGSTDNDDIKSKENDI